MTNNFGFLTRDYFSYEDGIYRTVEEFDFGRNGITLNVNSVDREKLLDLLKTNNRNTKETNKMEAKKCDRCGKLYEMPGARENNGADVRFKFVHVPGSEDMSGKKIVEKQTKRIWVKAEYDGDIDLCPDCRASLKKWFESTDKEEKK